jgi:hypothetical protein
MMNRTKPLFRTAGAMLACTLALAGCAGFSPNDPAREKQYVSVINSLTWTNPLSGKRDGMRSGWPLADTKSHTEQFPLAQLKQCAPDGACAWGVMQAQRSFAAYRYVPGGVQIDLTLGLDIDRRQEMHQPGLHGAMKIPSDVAALKASKLEQRTLSLQYGKVEHLEFDFGVSYDICALRYDAAGKPLDVCPIPYI